MKLHPVKSSNITYIGHKGDKLHVAYSSGHTYESDGVTADQHKALMSAKNHGKHLNGMGIKGKKLEK